MADSLEQAAMKALTELVACKDLKDRAEAVSFAGPLSEYGENWQAEYDRMRADYIRRQPLAWEAARSALHQEAGEPQQEGEGPLRDGWQLSIGPGHAGYGAYAHMTEYPEEGAVCLAAFDPKEYPDATTSPLIEQKDAGDGEDAARYRWLRGGSCVRQGEVVLNRGSRVIDKNQDTALVAFHFWCRPDELDAAIDAAIATRQGTQ